MFMARLIVQCPGIVVPLIFAGAVRASEISVGSQVLPKQERVEVRDGDRFSRFATPTHLLTVAKREGDRLYIGRGWLSQNDVVPIEAAESFFTEAIGRKPSAFAFASRSRALFHFKQFDRAIQDADAALRLDPKSPFAYKSRGRAKLSLGDAKSAIADFSEAIRIDPAFAPAYCHRGEAWLKLEDHQKAIGDTSRAIALDPVSPMALSVRGRAYSAIGRYDKSLDDFNALLALDPKYVPGLNNRANVLSKFARYAESIQDYTTALGIEERGDIYYNRAIAWARLGNRQKAIDDLTSAIRIDGDSAPAYYHRAQLYAQIGDMEKAAADMAICKSLNAKGKRDIPRNFSSAQHQANAATQQVN